MALTIVEGTILTWMVSLFKPYIKRKPKIFVVAQDLLE